MTPTSRSTGHMIATTTSSKSRSTWPCSTTEPDASLWRAGGWHRLGSGSWTVVTTRHEHEPPQAWLPSRDRRPGSPKRCSCYRRPTPRTRRSRCPASCRELADVLTNRGYVLMHLGDLTGARHHLQQAEYLFARIGMHLDRARVLGGLGSLAQTTVHRTVHSPWIGGCGVTCPAGAARLDVHRVGSRWGLGGFGRCRWRAHRTR